MEHSFNNALGFAGNPTASERKTSAANLMRLRVLKKHYSRIDDYLAHPKFDPDKHAHMLERRLEMMSGIIAEIDGDNITLSHAKLAKKYMVKSIQETRRIMHMATTKYAKSSYVQTIRDARATGLKTILKLVKDIEKYG